MEFFRLFLSVTTLLRKEFGRKGLISSLLVLPIAVAGDFLLGGPLDHFFYSRFTVLESKIREVATDQYLLGVGFRNNLRTIEDYSLRLAIAEKESESAIIMLYDQETVESQSIEKGGERLKTIDVYPKNLKKPILVALVVTYRPMYSRVSYTHRWFFEHPGFAEGMHVLLQLSLADKADTDLLLSHMRKNSEELR